MAPMYSQNTQMLRRALRLLALARTLALTLQGQQDTLCTTACQLTN